MEKSIILLFFALMWVGCEDPTLSEFQELKITKNHHESTPYWFSYENRDFLAVQYVFTDMASYDLKSPDQSDWNKLIGLSFHPFNNHRNSAMVSWRWNIEDSIWELGFYFHKDGDRIIAKTENGSEVFATTTRDCKTYFWINNQINMVALLVLTPTDTVNYTMTFPIDTDRKTRVINPWFGGNKVAPNDIYLLRKLTN